MDITEVHGALQLLQPDGVRARLGAEPRVRPARPVTVLEPARVVSRLRELRELHGDENGAQRVAWTDTWARARAWLAETLSDLPLEVERDEAGNDWYTLRGSSGPGRAARRSHGLGAERRLARRLPERARGSGGAAPGRGRGHAAGHRPARRLGGRGGRALRTLSVRVVRGGRVAGRPGRAGAAARPGRRVAPRGGRCVRCRSRSRRCGAPAARERGSLSRAPHRAGPSARVPRPPARRRARHVRRRAPPGHVARPGRPRGLHADGQAPRRAGGRGQAGAGATRHRPRHGRAARSARAAA